MIVVGRARLVREALRGGPSFVLRHGGVIYEALGLAGIFLRDCLAVVLEYGRRSLVFRRRRLMPWRGRGDWRRPGLGELCLRVGRPVLNVAGAARQQSSEQHRCELHSCRARCRAGQTRWRSYSGRTEVGHVHGLLTEFAAGRDTGEGLAALERSTRGTSPGRLGSGSVTRLARNCEAMTAPNGRAAGQPGPRPRTCVQFSGNIDAGDLWRKVNGYFHARCEPWHRVSGPGLCRPRRID